MNEAGVGDFDLSGANNDVPMASEEEQLGRGHRVRRATQKIRDALPVGPSNQFERIVRDEEEGEVDSTARPDEAASSRRRVILRVREAFKTAKNTFNMWRVYRNKPLRVPDAELPDEARCEPLSGKSAASQSPRAVRDIIAPLPNLSSWRYYHHFWLNENHNSIQSMEKLRADVLIRDDFHAKDLVHLNEKAVNEALAQAKTPWDDGRHGWKETSVKIRIPSGHKPTASMSRKRRAAALSDDEDEPVPAQSSSVDDLAFSFPVPGLHYRSLTQVIKSVLSSDQAVKEFHFEPFKQFVQLDEWNGPPERIFDELYTSDAWNDEHEKLQRSPPEPGCSAPRAIVALMFWSDATHVAQFGQAKLWPIYLYFGNQSKYTRSKRQAHAAHHIAYLPHVRCPMYDSCLKLTGTTVT